MADDRAEADGDVFVTPWAFHEPGFDIDIVKDLDGDGVYDVIDEHRWRAGECFGMSGTPDFGNPPIAFHAANGGFSSDESVNGTWTLRVRDTVDNGNNGTVQGWTLEIMSRFD